MAPPTSPSIRRCSTDPIYLSSHFSLNPHPPFQLPPPAAFHTTSLQARNYLTPPSSSSSTPVASDDEGIPKAAKGNDSEPSPIIPAQVSTRIESLHRSPSSFVPLWEEGNTFSAEEVKNFREIGEKVNELAGLARRFCCGGVEKERGDGLRVEGLDELGGQGEQARSEGGGGSRKGSGCFRLFHQNIQINHSQTPMCYVEDIYHARCGHWASHPRVYHQCARVAGNKTASSSSSSHQSRVYQDHRTCYNRKTCGSRNEDSVCKRCIVASREKLQKGTCMSVYSDGDWVKVLRSEDFGARMEEGKKRSSRDLEFRTPKSPSGFFSWNMQR